MIDVPNETMERANRAFLDSPGPGLSDDICAALEVVAPLLTAPLEERVRVQDAAMKILVDDGRLLQERVRELERTVLDDIDIIRQQKEGYEANVKIVADRAQASEARWANAEFKWGECNQAKEEAQAEIARLREALEAFIDWDGETWRIDSRHPNDCQHKEQWASDIAKARAARSSTG